VTFKTFGVRQLLNRWRKTVLSRRASKGEATLSEFQPRSRLLVAEATGGPKSSEELPRINARGFVQGIRKGYIELPFDASSCPRRSWCRRRWW